MISQELQTLLILTLFVGLPLTKINKFREFTLTNSRSSVFVDVKLYHNIVDNKNFSKVTLKIRHSRLDIFAKSTTSFATIALYIIFLYAFNKYLNRNIYFHI